MIQINLLRISPDSKYIEFSVECPVNYRFNLLHIKKYDWETTQNYPVNMSGWVDASSLYKQTSTKEVMRVSSDIFKDSTMFQVAFGVDWILEDALEPIYPDGAKLSSKITVGVCSDVNKVYHYMLQCILNLDSRCAGLSDEVKRMFVVLHGHTEAMRLGRYEDAEYLYSLLQNNFSICKGESNSKDCNCK